MPVKCIELDFGKPNYKDDDTLANRALGWIQGFNASWGEKLRSGCYSWGQRVLNCM